MAFDGITIANIVAELKDKLTGGRIYKIAQPESDELLLTIKGADKGGQYRLFLSADASLPLIYLTAANKPGPAAAPGFCMLLRKHLQNGRITDITQPGLERIVHIHIEHLNELGDLCRKKLIVEIMGKHSNIIFVNDEDLIIDSIKHISGMVSSVREVLPGRLYFIAETQAKKNPLDSTYDEFITLLTARAMPLYKALYGNYTGLSPVIAQEICVRADVSLSADTDRPMEFDENTGRQVGSVKAASERISLDKAASERGGLDENIAYRISLDGDFSTAMLKEDDKACRALYQAFAHCMKQVAHREFSPSIYYNGEKPVEFSALPLTMYQDLRSVPFSSISALLEHYYAEKNTVTRIRQKSVDLRKIVQTALERNRKKYDLQLIQIKDTEKKDRFRIYGELLNTYGYNVPAGAKTLEAQNYYNGEMVTIPLDPTLSPGENAKRYFDKYGKLKRTAEALSTLILEVRAEIEHLESVAASLDIALQEEDLVQIKEELTESGYIRRKGKEKNKKITSKPFHFLSSDGFHIYVGKNNYQNEELTFKLAVGNDWWFHAKGIPGSHVIVKTEGDALPDATFEEAARLAAYYSKGQSQEKVEVDYTEKKNVKKPGGGKPGFVVYYTNYSMMISPRINDIRQIP